MEKLLLGNCIEHMQQLETDSIKLTVTSPPYDKLRSYDGNNKLWCEHTWKLVIAELYRITKKGCVVVWIVGDTTIKGSETGTSFKQALWAIHCGFNLHDTMIYQKPAVPFDPKCNRYWQCFEYMFIFAKGKPAINYIKVPCKLAGKLKTGDYGQKRYDGSNRTDRHRADRVIQKDKVKSNIWYITSGVRVKGHPAQFPLQLAHDHILSWSNKEDTVLDPFMGSGTTGVACRNLKREFIGIELNPDYFKLAKDRINKTGAYA